MKLGIQKCIPTLQSMDAARSLDFYSDLLGFEKNREHRYEEDLPLFISMSHEKISIFITEHKNESAFGAELYFFVDDIDTLAERLQSKGIGFEVDLHDTPYGTREFNILDPDGNRLRIGQNLD